jgi:hypothetical protein
MHSGSSLYALLALGLCLAAAGCAGMPAAKPAPFPAAAAPARPSPAIQAALDEAEQVLIEVKKAGHEWRLIDPATGPDSETLTVLLDLAARLAARGQDGEALRIATRVKEAARLGLQQAADNAHAGPHYPN